MSINDDLKPPHRTPNDYLEAFRGDLSNAPLALYAGAALYEVGRQNEALAVWTLGDDANSALRTLHQYPQVNEEMRTLSTLADKAICNHFISLHQSTVTHFEQENNIELPRIKNAIWVHYHQGQMHYKVDQQKPPIFYLPDLPAKPFTHGTDLSWARKLEEASQDILTEFNTVKKSINAVAPYVPPNMPGAQWDKLRGNAAWSSLYVYFNAEKTHYTDLFPKTCTALEKIDLVKKNNTPMEVFFSILEPGAHIPPHYGLTNSRLTVHLPLIVPDNCSIRVGNDLHYWQDNKIIAFDDSFEHEAWNKSDQERVVLIFEIPHPDLTFHESAAIEQVYEAFDRWVASRQTLIGLG